MKLLAVAMLSAALAVPCFANSSVSYSTHSGSDNVKPLINVSPTVPFPKGKDIVAANVSPTVPFPKGKDIVAANVSPTVPFPKGKDIVA